AEQRRAGVGEDHIRPSGLPPPHRRHLIPDASIQPGMAHHGASSHGPPAPPVHCGALPLRVHRLPPRIVAILDKLLCAHAHMFLAGSSTCGGSRGFEQDITQHRSQFNKNLPHRWVSRTDKLLQQSNGSSAGVG
ncbi:unnamed protein product, partial [Closterium sp. Naga37s-1]